MRTYGMSDTEVFPARGGRGMGDGDEEQSEDHANKQGVETANNFMAHELPPWVRWMQPDLNFVDGDGAW
jgi:hypothetical protein